ncbi:unnamed protein product [Phytophthora fragariaefolia]|uniref:Unnamed protein product n=1 Tax=Phytophthora fragariaefolia TaxID=1490495 RepID=A0A9W6XLL3_9STRA|nr:unnamed protein product [Phytophthora fragariaefolia]
MTIEQFKNKINAVRSAYRARRTRLLATGNQADNAAAGSEDEEAERRYAEMPNNLFIEDSENSGHNINDDLTCDPMAVNPKYRTALGKELTALWPLLCDVFSGNPGCTGEPILESGTPREPIECVSDSDECPDTRSAGSDDECSDSSSQPRSDAKSNAKAHSKQNHPVSNRPVDVVADTLQVGLGSLERILASRQATGPTTQLAGDMSQLVTKLTLSIDTATASQAAFMDMQRDMHQSLRQSAENLQLISASALEVFAKMKEQVCGFSV